MSTRTPQGNHKVRRARSAHHHRRCDLRYTATVRARLRGTPAEAKKLHDDTTRATKDMAKQAGDLTHTIYLDPQDPKAFLGIDTWSTLEGLQKFAASPQI